MSEIRRHIGDEAEQTFLEALMVRTPTTPVWFVGIKKAGAGHDLNGIDAIISIRREDDRKPMSVPVQVKRSTTGKEKFLKTHPEAARLGVPILVVPPGITAEEIRDQTYAAVEPFLTVPRDHFARFLHIGKRRKRGTGAREILGKLRRKNQER